MTGLVTPWRPLDGSVALAALGVLVAPATAAADPPYWATMSWDQSLQVPVSSCFVPGPVPETIRQYEALPDATGLIGLFQPGGPTTTAENAFFASLGTNGRTCFSCHQPQDGWALKPETVSATFLASEGLDPVFAAVDGADCPDLVDDHQDNQCRQGEERAERVTRFVGARSQLFTKANFRIALPVEPNGSTGPRPQWTLRVLYDPYGCEKSAKYGLGAGMVSVYRRPLPAANLAFLDPNGHTSRGIFQEGFNIMWDAREPDLESQFTDATLIHAQRPSADGLDDAITQGVTFQTGLFTSQAYDHGAGGLDDGGATGGPRVLSTLAQAHGPNASGTFTIFDGWSDLTGGSRTMAARASIARGQDIFNGVTKTFFIDDVSGLSDLSPGPGNHLHGACGTCHNNPDRGNDFFLDPKRLGIEDNSCADPNTCSGPTGTPGSRRALPPPPDMPRFSFLCPVGSIRFFSNPVWVQHKQYDEFITTDPGLGLITGKCEDLGKMKVPILRGLASRAPFFHGGNAATLDDLVDFYDRRFDIQLTADEKRDLISFLLAL